MITEAQNIPFDAYIMARPVTVYEKGDPPYRFEVKSYDSACVNCNEILIAGPLPMVAAMPAGVDLTTGLVEKLEAAVTKLDNDHYKETKILKDKIANLLCLEAPKEDEGVLETSCFTGEDTEDGAAADNVVDEEIDGLKDDFDDDGILF